MLFRSKSSSMPDERNAGQRSTGHSDNVSSLSLNSKKVARSDAKQSSSGIHWKPPPPQATTISNVSASSSVAMLDAIAKSKGRRHDGDSRKYQQRQVPSSHLRRGNLASTTSSSSPARVVGGSSSSATSNTTQLQRLEADIAAKAKGKAHSPNMIMSKRNKSTIKSPPPSSSSPQPASTASITALNRMEADIAAKAKAKASQIGRAHV